MYIDTHDRSLPRGPPKYPPPIRPLLPAPCDIYLIASLPIHDGSLLLHPVPSPSLRIDMMSLHGQDSFTSSPPSFSFSAPSRRDSTSSVVDFTESLLPPTPLSVRPLTPANSVECRLQDGLDETFEVPFSKRSATPDQLHQLCFELESMTMKRHSSDPVRTTPIKRPAAKRACTEHDFRVVNSTVPTFVAHASSQIFAAKSTVGCHIPESIMASNKGMQQQGDVSFIDWDEELPPLAKMKKSIADLRSANRSRSNSAPLPPTQLTSTTSAQTKLLEEPSSQPTIAIVAGSQGTRRTISANTRLYSQIRVSKRRPRCRKTSLVVGGSKMPPPFDDGQRTVPPNAVTTTLITSKRRRASTVNSNSSRHRHRGLQRLSTWMKKVMDCA